MSTAVKINLPIGTILSEKIISDTRYKDGVMTVIEKRSICSTPIRERDILIENIFKWIQY